MFTQSYQGLCCLLINSVKKGKAKTQIRLLGCADSSALLCTDDLFAPGITVFTLRIGTPYLLTIIVLKFQQSNLLPLDVSKILLYVWQTVLTLIRRRILRRLIWVYTVCKGLSVPIPRVIMVLKFSLYSAIFTLNIQTAY